MKKIFQLALAAIPLVVAIYVDHGLVSDVHFALIGIVAICVALCDSLFGQVLANTNKAAVTSVCSFCVAICFQFIWVNTK